MSDKEQVIQALRATLISVKGALTLKQCNKDYRELQGEFIPYKKLGYPSLEKLFQDVPGFKIVQINGEWVVDAIASQETQHIASMVARQKSSKKPPAKLNYGNNFPKKQGSWRKPAPSNYYQTNYVDQYSKQFYRAKSQPLYNNNNNNKYNNKYNKYNEHRVTSNAKTKPLIEQNDHNISKSSANTNTPTEKESSNVSDDFKHSSKPEKQNEVKPIGKVSASQRLSNLRDRLNTVDLIPLHLPAHNESVVSQPVEKPPSFKLEPPPDLSSSAAKLEWTCQKLGLPQPVYKVQDLWPKKGSVTYHCSIKVGNEYFARSYPNPSPTEDLAKELAAVKILEEIIEKSTIGALKTSTSEEALTGLINLVSDHQAGVWAFDVPRLYTEKYQEILPGNWMDLVEKCPNIIKEKVVNDNIVLLPNTLSATNPHTEKCRQELTIDSDLPPLQFPDHDFWNVFITVANSTLEIWLRIIGAEYSDAFEALLADMAQHYTQYGTCVDKSMILVNAWYAVKLEEGGWQRAKILEIKDEKATVFLGDHGDDDIVSINKIKILEPQFRKLPAQAILCRLEGAEELAESEAGTALVRRRLPGEVLVAAPGPRHDPSDPSIAVVLYDTSTHRDLNLNREIVHDFCMSGAFTLTQKACEVEVGCVTDEGRVWVSRAGGAAAVRAALLLLTVGPYRRPLPAAPKAPPPAARALYIVRTLAGDWVRCTIISGLDGEGTVRTQLVDSGLILRAPLSSLVPLQSFSPALNEYPYQALQVRLGGAEAAAAAMVPRLRELLLGARVLCRALPAPAPAPAPTAAPAVELFVRTGSQNILASVNNDIQLQYEERAQGKPLEAEKETEVSTTVETLNKKKERIFRSTSCVEERPERPAGALPAPPLPAPGQSLDVFVAMAANPWNFVVQPNSTRHTFHAMMAALQVECPKIPESEAPSAPASGELYTAYYAKDSSWYRVVIAGVVSTQMVSVYFCDFGDLTLLSAHALRPAPAAVPDARALPPQAIKARLYNVCPLYKDWSVEDCIRFQELCVEQQFVGVCREVGRDQLNPTEPLLTLELIDTSTDEDIYLSAQLVKERRARLDTPA